jgi:hypothetical protein
MRIETFINTGLQPDATLQKESKTVSTVFVQARSH